MSSEFFLRYLKQVHLGRLKLRFPGDESIESNYSQAFQDLFVLMALCGKRGGTYVEVGAYHSTADSNTFLLESMFGWKGVSFEIVPERAIEFNASRVNKCVCANALTVDYRETFEANGIPFRVDYLQVDIEPAEHTLAALKRLPFGERRFSVITFETEVYSSGTAPQSAAREFLLGHGYELVVENVRILDKPFEDWYVDPSVVSPAIVERLKSHDVECWKCVLEEKDADTIHPDTKA